METHYLTIYLDNHVFLNCWFGVMRQSQNSQKIILFLSSPLLHIQANSIAPARENLLLRLYFTCTKISSPGIAETRREDMVINRYRIQILYAFLHSFHFPSYLDILFTEAIWTLLEVTQFRKIKISNFFWLHLERTFTERGNISTSS